jgi:hypothetical protein
MNQTNFQFKFQKRKIIVTIFSLFLGFGLLSLTLWKILEVDWNQVVGNIKSINPFTYFFAMASYYASIWLRGARWKRICQTAKISDNETLPTVKNFSGMVLMGWFLNSVAPMRLGDAHRGWTLARESNSHFSKSIGTVFAEKIQDIFIIIFLLMFAILALKSTGYFQPPLWISVLSTVLLSIVVILIIIMKNTGKFFTKMLPFGIGKFYDNFYKSTLGSFSKKTISSQLLFGILAWVAEIMRFYFVADAMNIEIPLNIIVFSTVAAALLWTVPIPGGLGFVEGGVIGLLVLFGLSETSAVSLVAIERTISWLSIILFGGLLFIWWHTIRGLPNFNKSE